MANPAKRSATYEDLLAVPEHLVAEILDGDLYVSPHPGSLEVLARSALGGELYGPFHLERVLAGQDARPGGWVIIDQPELHLRGSILVPDIAGWRRGRMPEMPDVAAFELAPDWVCEVLSDSTEDVDRRKKMPIYAGAGVGHIWLVNPLQQRLEVYENARDLMNPMPPRWVLLSVHGGDEMVTAAPFKEAEIDLAALWQR